MAKLNPWALPRPVRESVTKTFTENGAEIHFNFREPDAGDVARAGEVTRELVETFITGSEMRGPAPLPDDDIKATESLFMACALAQECQVPNDPDAYTALDFLGISNRLPDTWIKVQSIISHLTEKWQDDAGEARGARTD